MMESNQAEQQKGKNNKKLDQIKGTRNIIQYRNIHATGIPKEEEREQLM